MAKKKAKPSARDRLKKFQKKAGLEPTGRYDSVTRRNLKLARKGKPLQTPDAKRKRRAERVKAKANEPVGTAPLTEKTLNDEIGAQTRLRYGGQERAIQDEQRVSTEMRDRRIPSFYDDYLRQVQTSQMAQKAQYDQAIANQNAVADRDTAPAGASPEALQAAQARQAQTRSYAGLLATQGQNQQNRLFDEQRITTLRRGQAQGEEDNRLRSLLVKRRELEREKGDFATNIRTQARSSERNFQLQQAALGQKQEEAESKAALAKKNQKIQADLARSLIGDRKADNRRMSRQDKAERKFKRMEFKSEREKDAYQRKHKVGDYKPAASKGGKGGTGGGKKALTAGQLNDRRKITKAKGAYQRAKSYKAYIKDAPKDYELPVLHAGYELVKQGYIGPNTARQLRQLGYTIPPGWRKKPRRTAPGTSRNRGERPT